MRNFSGLRVKSQTWLKSHGSIFTSTIHALLTLHTAESSAVLDFQLHKSHGSIFTSTIHALLTLHTAESSAVLDFQLHKSHGSKSHGRVTEVFSLPPYTPCSRCILLRVLRCWISNSTRVTEVFSLPPYTPCSRCILLRVLRCWISNSTSNS